MMTEKKEKALPASLLRSRPIYGDDALARLVSAHVLVVGIGGVGGIAAELLARAGVGAIDLVDGDVFSESNLNRQLFSTVSAIGRPKVDVARERLLAIAPDCRLRTFPLVYSSATADEIDLSLYDYVVDAIDDVSAKILLALRARAAKVPLIASMGAGNKRDPSRFRVSDVAKTAVCPLARAWRTGLRKHGITSGVKAVWSDEMPITPEFILEKADPSICLPDMDQREYRISRVPASSPFCPNAAGLLLAHTVVEDLIAAP